MSDFDFTFTATDKKEAENVPYFEEARSEFAPYYATKKSVSSCKKEIEAEIGRLGGAVIAFREGYFGTKFKKRYGYEIDYILFGRPGVMRVAGLPMRHSETKTKVEQVKAQALLNVRDWLRSAHTQQTFQPGMGHPLMMNLLVDGKRTIADYITSQGRLPQLAAGSGGDVVDGEFREV